MACKSAQDIHAAWQRFEASTHDLRATAWRRMEALQAVDLLVSIGTPVGRARSMVANQLDAEGVRGASERSLTRWAKGVAGLAQANWAPFLLPGHTDAPDSRGRVR